MDHLKLTVDKLSVENISDLVIDESCGAVSLFVGTTRDSFDGKKVLRLEYEAYEPMAVKAMKTICDEVRNKWPSVYGIALYHRLGEVPAKEASVVIAVSSPHRAESLAAVAFMIDELKSSVPIWKKEVYDGEPAAWKENKECVNQVKKPEIFDKNLIQINVSNEELRTRIEHYIERKREQVNVSNIHDFIPTKSDNDNDETCARTRTTFIKRKDSKGHLKIHRVYNEWGPQISAPLPVGVRERMHDLESFLHATPESRDRSHKTRDLDATPVSRDVYARLRLLEDRVAALQAVSPEYAQFWKRNNNSENIKLEPDIAYTFTSDDINRKIEQLEKEGNML